MSGAALAERGIVGRRTEPLARIDSRPHCTDLSTPSRLMSPSYMPHTIVNNHASKPSLLPALAPALCPTPQRQPCLIHFLLLATHHHACFALANIFAGCSTPNPTGPKAC